jgi:prophage regulatory protein
MRTNHRTQHRGVSKTTDEKGSALRESVSRAGPGASQQDRERADKLALIPLKLLRFTAVRERTGLSRSTVWRLERRGAFPKHIRVSANIVAWLEEDVVEWIRAKAKGLVA